jgi:hypothetical protein
MQLLIKLMILAVVTSSAYADMPALRGSAAADFVQELAQLGHGGFSGDDEYDPCWIHTGCILPAYPFYDDSSGGGGHSGRGTTGWYCNDDVGATEFDKCRIKKGCNASDNCRPSFTVNAMWECVCS